MLQKELFCLSDESLKMLCWVMKENMLGLDKVSKKNKQNLFFTLTQKRFLKFSNNFYKLTIHGYDAIALHDLKRKGLLMLGDRIGTGKESDIYIGKLRIKTLEPVDLSKEKYDLKGELNPNYIDQSEETIYQCNDLTNLSSQFEYEEDLLEREINLGSNSTNTSQFEYEEDLLDTGSINTRVSNNYINSQFEFELNSEINYFNNSQLNYEKDLLDKEIRIIDELPTKEDKEIVKKSIFDIQNGTEFFSKKEIKINFEKINSQCFEKVVDVVIKFHRLGRTSFRNVKNLRDYQPNKDDWFSLSEKSAELESLNLLTLKNLQVPKFYLQYKHLVVMEYLYGFKPLNSVINIDKDKVYNEMCNFIFELYKMGFVHGDFNEFNVMINKFCNIKVIDFPQVITTTHASAKEYLVRDYKCINEYFFKKYKYVNRCVELEEAIVEIERDRQLLGID